MYSSSNWFVSRLSEDDFGMISAWLYVYIKFCLHIQSLIPIYYSFLTFHVCLELQAEQGFYFIGKDMSGFLKQKFQQLIGEHTASPQEVEVVMGRTLQVSAKLYCAMAYAEHVLGQIFLKPFLKIINIVRFLLVLMDAHIFLLRNSVTDHLEPQIILDCSVSQILAFWILMCLLGYMYSQFKIVEYRYI